MYSSVKYPSVIKKKISVNSFQNGMKGSKEQKRSDLSRAVLTYNFDYSEGLLKRGLGVSEHKDYSTVNVNGLEIYGIYEYVRYNPEISAYENKIVYYMSDKRLYLVDEDGGALEKISDVTFESKPTVIPYNYLDSDVLIISSELSGLYYLDGLILTKIEDAPEITSLCVHKERIFATSGGEGKSLWFSDDFNPTNWAISLDEAGFINFSDQLGKLLKVVSFLDYVYVFREYGISRVIAYGEQEEFTADNLYGKHGKIFGGSVTDCGDFIIMLTTAGIFAFNGLESNKILSEYDELLSGIDNQNAKGVYYDNRLYLKLDMKISGRVQTVILVYDVIDKNSYIARGLNVSDFCFFGSVNKILCAVNGENKTCEFDLSGEYLGEDLQKVWSSDFCDFSLPDALKNLYKVTVFSSDVSTLAIECSGKILTYRLKAGKVNVFYPCLKGNLFKFSISGKPYDLEISDLCAYISYARGS